MTKDRSDSTARMLLIDRLCDRFEQAHRLHESPRIESVLEEWNKSLGAEANRESQQAGDDDSTAELLKNLIIIELEYLLRQNLPLDQAGYLTRFPQFEAAVRAAWQVFAQQVRPEQSSGASQQTLPQLVRCRECFREFEIDDSIGASRCPHCGHHHTRHSEIATQDLLEPPSLSIELPDRFDIQGVIGEGAFGIVCRAWDRTLQRSVAIKAPRSERVRPELFLREARASSKLRHPNIVRVYDAGEINGRVFIVSDLIEGDNLRRWLARTNPSTKTICELMIKIVRAVQFSHENGVIHRDLKPGNILIDADGEPHILDFGLSHSIRQPRDSLAVEGRPLGTPAFMPPEQVLGRTKDIDAQSDVYSLGVILYQLLTRELPFTGSSQKIFSEILNSPPPPPQQFNHKLPAALSAICLKAMARERDARYPSANDLADELEQFLSGRRVAAYPHWEWRIAKSQARRWSPWLGLGALIALTSWSFWSSTVANEPVLQAIRIATHPDSAELRWIPFDEQSASLAEDRAAQSRAGQLTRLPPGFYKVIARTNNDYYEVFRTVPAPNQSPIDKVNGVQVPHHSFRWNGSVAVLPDITITPTAQLQRELVAIPGGEIAIPSDPNYSRRFSGQSRHLAPFVIDRREVTFGQLRQAFPQISNLAEEPDDVAAYGIPFDIALAYAEYAGMNLPSFWEFAWAASNRGTTRFSWGSTLPEMSISELQSQPELFADRSLSEPAVENLMLGRAEWTETSLPTLNFTPPQPGAEPVVFPGDIQLRMVYGVFLEREIGRGLPKVLPNAMAPGSFESPGRYPDNVGFRCLRRFSQ